MKALVGKHSPKAATFYCFMGSHVLCQDWPIQWTRCECPCHERAA